MLEYDLVSLLTNSRLNERPHASSFDPDYGSQIPFGLRNTATVYQAALCRFQSYGIEDTDYWSDLNKEQPLLGPGQGLVIASWI